MEKITAIMSVYNGQKYIHDSISSLLCQTSPNWLLICIDDGSTDNSLALLQEYAAKDRRIVVIHQENRGLSIARAVAFSHADTEYVSILDCDDALSQDYIEKMTATIERTKADAILSNVEYGYKSKQKYPTHFEQYHIDEKFKINSGVEAFGYTVPWRIHGWFCIKRDIVQKYYTIAEASSCLCKHFFDEYLARLMYLRCNTFAFCQASYLYRLDEGTITRSVSIKSFDALPTMEHVLNLCQKERMPAHIEINTYNEFWATLLRLKHKINLLPKGEQSKADDIIKEYQDRLLSKIFFGTLIKASPRTVVKFVIAKLKNIWL